MFDEGLKKGWLANWLITERVTGLGGSCIQLTQCDVSAHVLFVEKEITHTRTHTFETMKPISEPTFKLVRIPHMQISGIMPVEVHDNANVPGVGSVQLI